MILKFLHHLFNPHCEHCAEEARERNICKSCETLIGELARKQHEVDMLLEKLLKEPTPIVEDKGPVNITQPMRNATWAVRRQMLEKEDRKKAQLMREAPKPLVVAPVNSSVEELERELGVDDAIRPSDEKIQAG